MAIHIKRLRLTEDFRNLTTKFKMEMRDVNLLVGDQGVGKSSLLQLLQQNKDLDLDLSDFATSKGVSSFYFDTEKMNPRTIGDVNNFKGSIGLGLASHFKSHGEVLEVYVIDMLKKAENCVVLLDEPEAALSIKNQFRLVNGIQDRLTYNVQFVIATHNIPLIRSQEEVFDMRKMRWVKSDKFIADQEKQSKK